MLLEFVSLRLAIALLLGLAPALTLAGCGRDNVAAEQGNGNVAAPASPGTPASHGTPVTGRLDRSHAGTAAPTFGFQDGQGRPTSMAAFRGRPVLVNLWATWCAPCVAEMPTLDALAVREEGRLHVLALSQDLDGQAKVDAFFAERRFARLEPYIDPQLALMGELAVQSLPTTILYDAEGREVWRVTGIEDWQSARTAALIDEAASE